MFDPNSIINAVFFEIVFELKRTIINPVRIDEEVRIIVRTIPNKKEKWILLVLLDIIVLNFSEVWFSSVFLMEFKEKTNKTIEEMIIE